MSAGITTLRIKGNPTRRGLLEQVRRQAPGLLRDDQDGTMTPAEVSAALKVHPKTVTRYANEGKLSFFRTAGGHRRYSEAEVKALLDARTTLKAVRARRRARIGGQIAPRPGLTSRARGT